MPNKSDPNSNQPASPAPPASGQASVPSVFSSQPDLPPIPDFANISQTMAPAGSPSESPAQTGSPPIISTTPKKKFGGGRIIATILGILILVGGVGAGILLTQQKQLIPQKAACTDECTPGDTRDCTGANCIPGRPQTCATGAGGIECAHWTTCSDAAGDGTPTCEAPSGGGGGSVCIGCVSSVGTAQGMHDVTNLKVNLTSPTTASLTWSYGDGRTCPNRGGTYIFVGTDKSAVDNNCGLPGGSFWELSTPLPDGCKSVSRVDGSITSFNVTGLSTGITYYYRAASRYFFTDKSGEDSGAWCGGSTFIPSSPTPSPTPGAPQCLNVQAYNSTWTLLTNAQLSALTPGTIANFCVAGSADSGTFDKAQFKINSTVKSETTTKRPSSNDFCQGYTILSTDTTVGVKAKIHHATQGWVGETF